MNMDEEPTNLHENGYAMGLNTGRSLVSVVFQVGEQV